MENNKPVNNKSKHGEKFAWCKYHHVIIPLVIALLFIGVFMAGLVIGHEFAGDGGDRGERGVWQENYSGEQGFFNGKAACNENNVREQVDEREGKSANYVQEKNSKTNSEAEVEDSTSTDQNLNATSTENQ